MAPSTLANLIKMKFKAKVNTNGRMERFTKVNFPPINKIYYKG